MSLFNFGDFKLHSGQQSNFKIDCNSLSGKDLEALAKLLSAKIKFSEAIGIPTGGVKFANALNKYKSTGPVLIVDDVLTTGASMESYHSKYPQAIGVVIFTRAQCPPWIIPMFYMVQL